MDKTVPDGKIEIKQYSKRYKDQIRDVIGRTLADISVVDKNSLPIDDPDLDRIEEVYSGKGRFWVALDGDKVVGTVAIRDMGGNVAKLNRMFVLVNYHGTGIGQILLDQALDFASEKKFSKIILNTYELMHRAHRFYEKNNFTRKDKKGNKFFYEKNLK